jgi:hypothetical protein
MSNLRRTLSWIFVGTVNGVTLGAVLGLCFGWFTVGCNVPGNESAFEGAVFGAILGGMIGVLTGAVCEARNLSPRRMLLPTWLMVGGDFFFLLFAIPAIHLVTSAAARMKSIGSLKQIGLAMHNYHDKHGFFPMATLPQEGLPPEKRLSWFVAILPYVERQELFDSIDRTKAWDAEENRQAVRVSVHQFWNPYLVGPSPRDEPGLTYYVGIAGVGKDAALLPLENQKAGVFGYSRRVRIRDITDGTSNTMMVVDSAEQFSPWAAGGAATVRGLDPNRQPYVGYGRPFGGLVKEGGGAALALLADGSVRTIQTNVKPEVFEALATIAGGEEIHDPDF